ncbi:MULTISPECIES: polymer-forming cytoskeletal protein [Haloferacaceae]|uniref:DUF8173 domain-containing protein n=1 Tax=Halorubrum glutamatedens TaxID=2707018 RepID=A0ABD5QWU4_9EURY|nr:polymer-forming cytoskeletal protein [Halobellus captivus]
MISKDDRLGRLAILAIVALLCLSIAPGIASAQEQRTGGTVTIGQDETHEGDLEITGGEILVAGTIDGDLTVTGGTVTITGDVAGDVTATGGSVVIEGTTDGSLTATGGDVQLHENATIGRTLVVTGGTITVDSTIGGDAQLDGETIIIGPEARIDGDLNYSGDDIDIADDADISGEITEHNDPGATPFSDVSLPDIPEEAIPPLVGVYVFLANFMLGAVLLGAAPRFSDRVSERGTDRPLVSGILGLATLFGMPFVLGGLFLSIVGIPLAFFASYGFLFLLWIGLVYGAFVVGTWELSVFDRTNRWGGLALGLATVSVIQALPYVGFLLVLISLLGIGAFARTLYTQRVTGGENGPATGDDEFSWAHTQSK